MIEFPIKREKGKVGNTDFTLTDLPIKFFMKIENKEIKGTDFNVVLYGTSLKEEQILELSQSTITAIAKKVAELSGVDDEKKGDDKKK